MALYVIYLNDKARKAPFLKIGCHLWMPLEKTSFMDAPVHLVKYMKIARAVPLINDFGFGRLFQLLRVIR